MLNFVPDDLEQDEDEESDKTWIGTSPESDGSLFFDDDDVDEDDVIGTDNADAIGSDNDDAMDDADATSKTSSKTFDFDGVEIETKGNYSKCPKCDKKIKSTFILRHIKLHDLPVEKFRCPGNVHPIYFLACRI